MVRKKTQSRFTRKNEDAKIYLKKSLPLIALLHLIFALDFRIH